MRICTRLLYFVCILTATLHLQGQGPNVVSDPDPAKGKIKGKVIDGTTEAPLEFATISLLSASDSSIVTGEVTDLDGNFNIEASFGEYLVKLEFIGYEAGWRKIVLSKQQPNALIGAVALNTNAQVLAEVEVRAEKSQLQMGLDKKSIQCWKGPGKYEWKCF